jgi:hypothetical protein
MSVACNGTRHASAVAIADQPANGPFSPIAVVTNSGCNIFHHHQHRAPRLVTSCTPLRLSDSELPLAAAPSLAVTANNGDATASVVNLLTNTQPVTRRVGTNPIGVAFSDELARPWSPISLQHGLQTNLGLLLAPRAAFRLRLTIGGIQQPIAVAIESDRGTTTQGLAVPLDYS